MNYKHIAMKINEKINMLLHDIKFLCPEAENEYKQLIDKLDKYIGILNILARMQELDEFKALDVEQRYKNYKKAYDERIKLIGEL